MSLVDFKKHYKVQTKILQKLLKQKTNEYYRNLFSQILPIEYLNRCSFEDQHNLYIEDDFGTYVISDNSCEFATNDNMLQKTVLKRSPENYTVEYACKKDHFFNFKIRNREYEDIDVLMLSLSLSFWEIYIKNGKVEKEEVEDVEEDEDFIVLTDLEKEQTIKSLIEICKKYTDQIQKAKEEIEKYNMEARKKEEDKNREDLESKQKMNEIFEKQQKRVENRMNKIKEMTELSTKCNGHIDTIKSLISRKKFLKEESDLLPEELEQKISDIDKEIESLKCEHQPLFDKLKDIRNSIIENM